MISDELSYKIRGAIFEIHNQLGPGLLESVYHTALLFELSSIKLEVRSQVVIPILYKGVRIDAGYRIDLLIDESVIIEIKSVEVLHDVHKKQLLTYLKLANKKLGFLVNFNVSTLTDKISLIRIIN